MMKYHFTGNFTFFSIQWKCLNYKLNYVSEKNMSHKAPQRAHDLKPTSVWHHTRSLAPVLLTHFYVAISVFMLIRESVRCLHLQTWVMSWFCYHSNIWLRLSCIFGNFIRGVKSNRPYRGFGTLCPLFKLL